MTAGKAFELLNERAAQAPPGSDGLIPLPHPNTTGACYWNAEARGAHLGFTQNHGPAHFARGNANIYLDHATHAVLAENHPIYPNAYRSLAATTFSKIAKPQAS